MFLKYLLWRNLVSHHFFISIPNWFVSNMAPNLQKSEFGIRILILVMLGPQNFQEELSPFNFQEQQDDGTVEESNTEVEEDEQEEEEKDVTLERQPRHAEESLLAREVAAKLRPLVYAQISAETGKAVLGPSEDRIARAIESELVMAIQQQISLLQESGEHQELTKEQIQRVLIEHLYLNEEDRAVEEGVVLSRSPRQAEVESVKLTLELTPAVRAIQSRLRPLVYAQIRAETGKTVLGPLEERLARQIERQLAVAIQQQIRLLQKSGGQKELTAEQIQQVLIKQTAGIQQRVRLRQQQLSLRQQQQQFGLRQQFGGGETAVQQEQRLTGNAGPFSNLNLRSGH